MSATAVLILLAIAAGVAAIAVAGVLGSNDRDDFDVSDYRPEPGDDLVVHGPAERRSLRPGAVASLDVLPPAPAGATAPLSVYAEVTVEGLQRARYGSTDPAVIAGRMLAEIAADEHGDVIWNRATDRDLTGVFPVVAVAR